MSAMIWTRLPFHEVRTSRALDRAVELLMADWIAVGDPRTLDMVDLLKDLKFEIDACDAIDFVEDFNE